ENDWNFNVNAIGGFVKDLKDTISFSKLGESDTVSLEQVEPGEIVEQEDGAVEPDVLKHLSITASATRPEGATMRQDVFSLTEGQVVLSWPTPLSKESVDDLKDWLKI